jgi:hypothetical protein
MSYVIEVMVIDRRTRKGLVGENVKSYGGSSVKTNTSGLATVISKSSSATIYVNGFQVYNGSALGAPNPIIYTKG